MRNFSDQIDSFQNVVTSMRTQLELMPDDERRHLEEASAVLRKVRAAAPLPILPVPAIPARRRPMSQPRTPAQVLREARQKDSRDKRARVLSVVDQLIADDESVTFTGVARAANVSHWLVYAEGVREHIEAARRRQTRAATSDARAGAQQPRPDGKLEQQLLQQDNRRLREEVERLKAAVRRNLGQQLDQFGAADLGTRVDELTADNHRLQNELDKAQALVTDLTTQLNEAHDDLTAARTSIRQLIRAENTPLPRSDGDSRPGSGEFPPPSR